MFASSCWIFIIIYKSFLLYIPSHSCDILWTFNNCWSKNVENNWTNCKSTKMWLFKYFGPIVVVLDYFPEEKKIPSIKILVKNSLSNIFIISITRFGFCRSLDYRKICTNLKLNIEIFEIKCHFVIR